MDDLRTIVGQFLREQRTASLATVDEGGRAHAANVQYVCDAALRLVWVSSQHAAHSQHVAARPDAAVTIHAGDESPATIRGVQMHGRVVCTAHEDAWPIYVDRYPFIAHGPFAEVVAAQQFYRFTPTWLRWIDNRVHFGFKREVQLPAAEAT